MKSNNDTKNIRCVTYIHTLDTIHTSCDTYIIHQIRYIHVCIHASIRYNTCIDVIHVHIRVYIRCTAHIQLILQYSRCDAYIRCNTYIIYTYIRYDTYKHATVTYRSYIRYDTMHTSIRYDKDIHQIRYTIRTCIYTYIRCNT